MRKGLIFAGVALLTLTMTTATRGGYEEGMEALEREDYKKAFKEFRSAAEGGDAKAGIALGCMYLGGPGVPKDDKEALRWFLLSRTFAAATLSGPKDDKEVLRWLLCWLLLAAEQGNPQAQRLVASAYEDGTGVPQSFTEAAKWFMKAAIQGDAAAQTQLGLYYANGRGVPQDFQESAKWSRKAAEQGVALAQSNLGVLYAQGKGVPQDYREAASWFEKAADQGLAEAQANLGLSYVNGWGVGKNLVRGYCWLSLAADQGNDLAGWLVMEVFNRMSSAQVAKAQELFTEGNCKRPFN